jgi:hypothetical protein
MATIRLTDRCSRPDDLPDVCMKCGRDATGRVMKKFYFTPSWVWLTFLCGGLPVLAIVALIVTKSRRVSAPLCAEHQNHWSWRTWTIVGVLLVMVAGLITSIVIASEMRQGPGAGGGEVVAGLFVVGLLGWLIMTAILSQSAIRTTEITDDTLTLTGVSKEFRAAVEKRVDVDPEMLDRAVQRWGEARRRPSESGDDESRYRREGEEDQRPDRDRYRE